MLNFDILDKGLVLPLPPHFVYDFFKKFISHVVFYEVTKLHRLETFTS